MGSLAGLGLLGLFIGTFLAATILPFSSDALYIAVLAVRRETLQKQKAKIDRYGVWLALICWVPFVGDVIAIALGFYRTPPVRTMLLLLVGKFLRFWGWNLLMGFVA